MSVQSECLKLLRMVFRKRRNVETGLRFDMDGQAASDLIKDRLLTDQPCMISRFGSNELDATLRVFEQRQTPAAWARFWRYLRGDCGVYWWDNSIRKRMALIAGFFPVDDESLMKFGELMLTDIKAIDVLGSWRQEESHLRSFLPAAKRVPLLDLEPYRHAEPWSAALAGKRVLLVHPFAETIQTQYEQREKLFDNPDVLPLFELLTLKAIQSNGKQEVAFADWFEALERMCADIRQLEFDIAIIGAGAYGLPLAAFVKRLGKKSVHLGGATQLLFGIKGRRWDEYCQHLYNDHWTRPSAAETPPRSDLIEGHAYW